MSDVESTYKRIISCTLPRIDNLINFRSFKRIELKFTLHKKHHLQGIVHCCFVYSQCRATITSIWFQNFFIAPKGNPVSISRQSPDPLPPAPSSHKSSVSMDLPDLDISEKWDHTVGDLLCLAFFSQHHVCVVLPCCSVSQYFLPFYVIFSLKQRKQLLLMSYLQKTRRLCAHYPSRISQLLLGKGYKLPFGFPKPQSSDEVSSLCT